MKFPVLSFPSSPRISQRIEGIKRYLLSLLLSYLLTYNWPIFNYYQEYFGNITQEQNNLGFYILVMIYQPIQALQLLQIALFSKLLYVYSLIHISVGNSDSAHQKTYRTKISIFFLALWSDQYPYIITEKSFF